MKYDNKVSINMESKSQNESFARVCVASFVSVLDPTMSDLEDIKMAVSEAVTNSIIHGYEDNQGIVKLEMYIKEDIITIEVSDEGKGIENINEARKPLYTSKPDMDRSGMGFTVMEAFMDSVKVESKTDIGTTITMTKKITIPLN